MNALPQEWMKRISEEDLRTIQNSIDEISDSEYLEITVAQLITSFIEERISPIFTDELLKDYNDEWDTSISSIKFGKILKRMGFKVERVTFEGKRRRFIASFKR